MWNLPYAVALWNPARQRTSLYEAVAMQAIGVVGETLLMLIFPAGHAAIRAAIGRFIVFDGSGLGLLVIAAWLVK
jgi:CO dehydrogenase/acetyl-CoA synthase delta subunit